MDTQVKETLNSFLTPFSVCL